MAAPFEFDKYIEHSKEDAYRFHQDEKNISSLRMFILIFSIISGFITITTLFDGSVDYDSYAYFAMFAVSLFIRIFYHRIFNLVNIRRRLFLLVVLSLLGFLLSGILQSFFQTETPSEKITKTESAKNEPKGIGITVDIDEKKTDTVTIVIFFSLFLLFFRFPKSDIVQLYSLVLGLPVLTELLFFRNFGISGKIPEVITAGLCFVISYSTERKRHGKFYKQYEAYFKRHSDSVRMKRELNYAREIQLSMLPENRMEIGDLKIAATSLPASEVGGDYYDYFKISDGVTGIFICDVSGHGVASALLLSGLRSCMHLILEDTANPKEVFDKLNRMIRRTQNRKMFVTAVFAVIDTNKGKCTLFNAGHLPPYRISGESHELFKIKRHGITLGAVERLAADGGDNLVSFDFNKGDILLLYTDGITEAMNSYRGEYGFERLENFLYSNQDTEPSKLIDDLVKDVKNFTGDAEQLDDISILVLSR
ncbi:MAG: PP2C family protein-serine/threonine phosphatase [Ignavibacteria bacterium]|nr:PP2C family protein-serine/threonine phosphatase [Ignavibacteria bacterium]